MTITIAVESPLQDDVRLLIRELNETLLRLTPLEHCYHMTVEEMAQPDTTVFIARDFVESAASGRGGVAVGCGALKRHSDGVGEVKRMYTRPQYQGKGIGGLILAQVEYLARREGLSQLVLETGDGYHAAWRVYERGGFTRCGAVLDYPDTKWSVFFEKRLETNGANAA